MPGRTPSAAIDSFIEPIEQATACLGHAKIVISGRKAGALLAWALNGPEGMVFSGGRHFEAQMQFEVIRHGAQWRVTTRAYRYRFAIGGIDMFRMHWHPNGNSPFKLPHLHINFAQNDFTDGTEEQHLPSGRMTYEDAVAWAIGSGGVTPARHDWETVLQTSRDLHIAHRTWSVGPADALRASE